MSFKINEHEWDLFYYEEPILFKIYCSIRKHMDYDTRIAGLKRRFNSQHFIELLSREKTQGKKPQESSRYQIHRLIKKLEKLGAILHHGNFVFECLLADQNESVSEKCAHLPHIFKGDVRTPYPQPNHIENKVKIDSSIMEVRTAKKVATPQKCALPQESGIYIKKDYVQMPKKDTILEPQNTLVQPKLDDEGFLKFWAAYPKKQKRKESARIWKRDKLEGKIDQILHDIEIRKKTLDWTKEGGIYVPMPSTYLHQARFLDETKGTPDPKAKIERVVEKQEPKFCVVCGEVSTEVCFWGSEKVEACNLHAFGFKTPDRYKIVYGAKDPFFAFADGGSVG